MILAAIAIEGKNLILFPGNTAGPDILKQRNLLPAESCIACPEMPSVFKKTIQSYGARLLELEGAVKEMKP